MEVVLEQKDAADWTYRGEGAVNLVLAYAGSSPAFVGKVLRIQKTPRNKSQCKNNTSILSTHEVLLWKNTNGLVSSPTKEVAEQLFVQHVMIPLLGSEHVDPGVRVCIARDFLVSVEENVRSQRPTWRVDASEISSTLCDSALLMFDHSLFSRGVHKGEPCISVEIKPKCGFLPVSKFIAEGSSMKRSISRFRMHQLLKLHKKEILQISEYDPLDLFSGSLDRIHKAIKALFTTPQNNFRVFLNGSLIYGALGGGTDGTSFLNGGAFENALKHVIHAEDGLHSLNFLLLIAETIFRSEVLDLLLKAQKLDNFDIEGAIHAYYNIVSQPCMVCRNGSGDKLSDKYDALHSIPLDESLNIVRDYLIAATAKDCSLMISFRPREGYSLESSCRDVYLESTNQSFEYKAYFIDLDMKPLKKMEYYYGLDQRIVGFYTKMASTKPQSDEASKN